MSAAPRVFVVTGLSGAGRSTALHVLEDAGIFCVDNLPPSLALDLLGLATSGGELERVGLGIDVRNGAFLSGATEALAELELLNLHVATVTIGV